MPHGVFPAMEHRRAPGGLFSAAEVNPEGASSVRWEDGPFQWDTITSPLRVILGDLCSNGIEDRALDFTAQSPTSWPFSIITAYECATPGYSPEERRALSLKQLEAVTEKAVEIELWSGAVAQAAGRLTVPYLSDNSAVDVTGGGTAVDVQLGIAKLEQALADCGLGTQGVIHLTRQAASVAGSIGAIKRDDDRLHTILGTPVVAGTGYSPSIVPADPVEDVTAAVTAIAAVPDSPHWGYATGPVTVLVGAAEHVAEDVFDHTNNLLTVLSARPAAVFWDSRCTAAVQMDTAT